VLGKKVRAGTASPEEQAEFQALSARAREASKKARAALAPFAYFDTTLRMVHYPQTHTVVDAGHGVHVDYSVDRRYVPGSNAQRWTEEASIRIYVDGVWTAHYSGKDALDKVRMFVAARLADGAARRAKQATDAG